MTGPIRKPRDRKSKHRDASKHKAAVVRQDSNVVEILPVSKADKDEKRRQREEERRARQPKISKKKQKRLETYIAKKLRKDENLHLVKKLARAKVDTSLFQSSKSLGRARETRQDILDRHRKEIDAGLRTSAPDGAQPDESGSSSSDAGSDSEEEQQKDSRQVFQGFADDGSERSKATTAVPALGSGLKRPLDLDQEGKPVIVKRRKRSKTTIPTSGLVTTSLEQMPSEDSSSDAESDLGSEKNEKGSTRSSVRSNESAGPKEVLASDGEDAAAPEDSTDTSDGEPPEGKKPRITAFKAWADQQRNQAQGFVPSVSMEQLAVSGLCKIQNVPRPGGKRDEDPLPPELQSKGVDRKAFAVEVERNQDIQKHRLALPVTMEEHKIMEAIHNNPAVLICGTTGSGKTTQIPQFLFESGYGSVNGPNPGVIGITQPRRVAAVSMARRVAAELGHEADRVAYKIRFEGSVSAKTAIKFMTDGILLREAAEDIALQKYSAIVIDEAHEMSKDTSILIGMMSRIIRLRDTLSKEDPSIKPLKLVIMSATLGVADITENKTLFPTPPPVIDVEGRQHPVTIHWARKTNYDYVEEAYRKIRKGHRTLPPGGMLVFLTGRSEIIGLAEKLKKMFLVSKSRPATGGPMVQLSGEEAPVEAEDVELGQSRVRLRPNLDAPYSEDSADEQDGDEDEDDDDVTIGESLGEATPVHILPLYSLLPTSEQLRVFESPPEGSRLIVLATNIAETSLTIPGISYVFDCGRVKERRYNDETGVQSFEVDWISKASAVQRAGRAGRTGPGHCYRLYSSAVYERDFEERPQPELQRTPLEGVVLQLMGLGVPNILETFPFPAQPDRIRLTKAKNLLSYLGAVSPTNQLTKLGQKMAALPLMPRFSKILLEGDGRGCLPYTIALVAALSVPDLFITEESATVHIPSNSATDMTTEERERRDARTKAYDKAHARFSRQGRNSDALKLVAAALAEAEAPSSAVFCAVNFLRPKAMREIQMLRSQLCHLLRADPSRRAALPSSTGSLPAPSDKQLRYLEQVVAAGFVDQVAIRADLAPTNVEQARQSKRAINVPYLPLFPRNFHGEEEKAVYVHPSSVLARTSAGNLPPYVIYSRLQRSANASKVRMHPLTAVNAAQLAMLTKGTTLQQDGKPIKEVITNEADGIKRVCWVVPSLRGGPGSQGWPLPARKVVQRMRNGIWVEET